MNQVSTNNVSVAQQPDQGNPFLNALGTFLPMAFGLPPMPQLGQLLSGASAGMQGPMLSQGGPVNPFNPFGDDSQSPFEPQQQPPTAAENFWADPLPDHRKQQGSPWIEGNYKTMEINPWQT